MKTIRNILYRTINKIPYRLINKILHSGYFGHVHLKEIVFKNLPENLNTYIDIGAYDGYFYEVVAREKKIKNVILIEPQKNAYEALIKKYEHHDNIKIYNYLLSDKIEERTFFINKIESTSSLFEFDGNLMNGELDLTVSNTEMITTNTLDNIIQNNDQIIDLLKIDVQGGELLVLNGGVNTLKSVNFIWIEVSFKKIYNNIPTFEDIYLWLYKNGFQLIEIMPGYRNSKGELLQADCLFKKGS